MLCERPYLIGLMPCPCMRCAGCLFNKKRIWAARLLLEQKLTSRSCFITLTYDEKHIPTNGSVSKSKASEFMRALRREFSGRKIRYFIVGEYGDTTQRPHYHAAIFGVDAEEIAGTKSVYRGKSWLYTGAPLSKLWKDGFSSAGELTEFSSKYIAQYVVKKMTGVDDVRLRGRSPEFARMSLRPGIGAGAARVIAEGYMQTPGALDSIATNGDVPTSFKLGGKSLPLGRYIRRRLRYELGFKSMDVPEESLRKKAAEVQELLEESQKDKKNAGKGLGQIMVESVAQKIINLKARQKIWRSAREI